MVAPGRRPGDRSRSVSRRWRRRRKSCTRPVAGSDGTEPSATALRANGSLDERSNATEAPTTALRAKAFCPTGKSQLSSYLGAGGLRRIFCIGLVRAASTSSFSFAE